MLKPPQGLVFDSSDPRRRRLQAPVLIPANALVCSNEFARRIFHMHTLPSRTPRPGAERQPFIESAKRWNRYRLSVGPGDASG